MADDVQITAGSGTAIATDDVGGSHYQKVKLVDGTADSSTAIPGDSTYGLDVDVTRLGRSISKAHATGSGAISGSFSAGSATKKVASVTVHLSGAPTGTGNLTITLDTTGTAYEALYLAQSMVGVTDFVWFPDGEVFLISGDALLIQYPNPDGKTYGLQVTLELVA